MKKYLAMLILSLTIFSCEKYPEPDSVIIESFGFTLIGSNQEAVAGNYLEEGIGAVAYFQSEVNSSPGKFRTEFTVTSGGGSVDESVVEAGSDYVMTTRWKLGTEQNKQTVKGKIMDASGKVYHEFTINAVAYIDDKLNIVNSGFLTSIRDMVCDTANQRSLMIAGSAIYNRKGFFYEWEPVFNNRDIMLKDIEINSKNEVFGGSWTGKLYKSTDWGKSWNYISNPIPGYEYNYQLTISNDDLIWANQWEKGMYCSEDNGATWHHDTAGFDNKEMATRVYSAGNGSHFTLSLPLATVLQSSDKGYSWEKINSPAFSNEIFVTDKNELIVCNQENGLSLHKSTDNGKTFRKVLSAEIAFRVAPMSFIFGRYRNDYFFLAPGGGVYKTVDFEVFEEIISFDSPQHLFIDHTGTLYAGSSFGEPVYILPSAK